MKFDANKDVTNRLKFKPEPQFDNLCRGKLINVEVVENKIEAIDEKGRERTWEYAGHTIPSLVFEFKQYFDKDNKDAKDRYFIFRQNVIGSVKKNGEPIKDSSLEGLYQSMWDRIKHIHDAFKEAPAYKPFKSIPAIDERAEIEARLDQITKFFNTIADGFNKGKDDKAIYEGIILWMKLTAEYNEGKYLTFPAFVGEGFIERYVEGVSPTIELKPSESVILAGKASKAQTGTANPGVGSVDDLPPDVQAMLAKEKGQ